MKLKHKRIPFFFGLLILVSTVLASFAPIFEGHASAADEFGCTYTYGNVDQSVIKRAGCQQGGLADANYALTNTGGQVYEAWTLSEGGCDSTILIQNKGGDLQLNGKVKTSSGCQAVAGGTVITVEAGASDQNTQDAATRKLAYVAYLKDSLQSLIDAHCAANEKNGAPTNCSDAYYTAISTCVDKVIPKVSSDDQDPNQKFLDLFSACMINELPNSNLKKKDITSLLGSNVYDDLIATGDAAINTGSTGDGGDACNVSINPLTWFLCPIFDGFGTLTDFLLKEVLTGFLKTAPLTISSSDPVYKIWSSFRIWGNIFLVIALLVIVFGESIGGGLIDAYTAKKVLPRILIAAILINLSYYIVALLVDFTNILGQSIGNIITAPLNGVSLSPGAATKGTVAMGLFVALSGAAAGITGVVGYLLFTAGVLGAVAGSFVPFLLLFILLPAFVAIVLVFFTLILRKAIILALVLISPVAFALYCLPNTEKYFRQWWELLFKTLLIYPIVMVVFAACDVLAYTSIKANGNGSFFGYLLAFLLQFLPLLLIPFAFKVAGGVIGRLHGVASGFGNRGIEGIKGDIRDENSLRNKAQRRRREGTIRGRETAVAGLGGIETNQNSKRNTARQNGRRGWRNRVGSTLAGRTGSLLNYGDLEAQRSALTKQESEIRELKTGYGPDDSVRAFFATEQPDGTWVSKTTGKAYSGVQARKAHQLYKGLSAAQTAIDYELGKAEPEQYNKMVMDTVSMLDEKGYQPDEINGIMKGVGFKNQGKYLDLKHSSFEKNADGTWTRNINNSSMAMNAAVDFGSYPISNMKPAPIKQLQTAHVQADTAISEAEEFKSTAEYQGLNDANKARAVDAIYKHYNFKEAGEGSSSGVRSAEQVARQQLADVEATASTLDTSWRSQGGGAQQVVGEADGAPITPGGPSSGAPGRVDAEIRTLVDQVNSTKARRGGGPQGPTPPVSGGGPAPGGGGPSSGGGTSPHRYTYP